MARNFVAGSSQYLSYGTAILTASPITVSAWFKLSTITTITDTMCIFSLSDWAGGDSGNYSLSVFNNAGTISQFYWWATGTGGQLLNCSANPATNVWNHGCGIELASNSRAVYLNGANKTTGSTSVTAASGLTATAIGRQDSSGSAQDYFDGDIAEVGLWNVALTDAEVAILALGYSPLFVRPASLVAYWPLIGNASPEPDLKRRQEMTLTATPAKADHPRIIYPSQKQRIAAPGSVSYSMDAAAGALSLSGAAADLKATRLLQGNPRSFVITGAPALTAVGRAINAEPRSFAQTGAAADLKAQRVLQATAGGVVLTGQPATLASSKLFNAGAGSYSATGMAAALAHGFSFNAGAGTHTISGAAATLQASRLLVAASGTYTATGAPAQTSVGRAVNAAAGAYAASGAAATLTTTRALNAAAGANTIDGKAASLLVGRQVAATAGSYALTGVDVTYVYSGGGPATPTIWWVTRNIFQRGKS